MYKKFLWFFISVLILVIGSFVTIIYFDFNGFSFNVKDSPNLEEDITGNNEVIQMDIEKEPKKQEYLNPFNQKQKQEELTDRHYQDYIHKMSHQKVIADTKWGFYLITDERIEWLLESLEITYDSLDDGKIYRDILSKWKNGDFSKVDQDHNMIWNIQGGSIGKATGILNKEEEENYIENTTEAK